MIKEQGLEVLEDYREWLIKKGVSFVDSGIYILIGESPDFTGWMLELGVIALQLDKFMNKVLPFLIGEQIPFALPLEREAALVLISSGAGYAQTARLIVVFPTPKQVAALAHKLINITDEFRSPEIPGTYWLGGCVYARYSSFKVVRNEVEKFTFPRGCFWPFEKEINFDVVAERKILNNTYRIVEMIKHNPKGDAMKALYYKGLFNIGKCFIKQGRVNTFMDSEGRDSTDRLRWQHTLLLELDGMEGVPRVLDLFEVGRDSYLVTELINGQSLTEVILDPMLFTGWKGIHSALRKQIVGILLQIVRLVQEIHKRGYLHRDIAPENFLIKKGRVYMIDLELAWNQQTGHPSPAFLLGSPGYMSPSQRNALTPVLEDDIYSLGALMLFSFFAYQPARLSDDLTEMKQRLINVVGFSDLADLIIACLQPIANERPKLSDIEKVLTDYHILLSRDSMLEFQYKIFEISDLEHSVKKLINAICSSSMCNEEGIWWSIPRQNRDRLELSVQRFRAMYPALIDGVGGVLLTLAMAKKIGLLTERDCNFYHGNLRFLRERFIESGKVDGSLYDGKAGVAVALSAGIASKLISDGVHARREILFCLQQSVLGIDVAAGAAGHGLAVLHCLPYLNADCARDMLEKDLAIIVKELKKRTGMGIEFSSGLAGVLYFLWTYLYYFEDTRVRKCAFEGMKLLEGKIRRQGKNSYWIDGSCGIIKAYLRAYQITGSVEFKKRAETLLDTIPLSISPSIYEYISGTWGLGDILVEAVSVLARDCDKVRLRSIVERVFYTMYNSSDNGSYWVLQSEDAPVAGGISDNSGGLFFMLRVLYPEKINAFCDPVGFSLRK